MIKVLFVCLGNICRSPMAEAIFHHQVQQADLGQSIHTDSAGTSNYHPGEPPDHRTLEVLRAQGIETQQTARQIKARDFQDFDYILAMDRNNFTNIERMADQQGKTHARLKMMGAYAEAAGEPNVPDPYYGDLKNFADVYAMLAPACENLLSEIRETHNL